MLNHLSDNAYTGICRSGFVSHCEKTALPSAQSGSETALLQLRKRALTATVACMGPELLFSEERILLRQQKLQ